MKRKKLNIESKISVLIYWVVYDVKEIVDSLCLIGSGSDFFKICIYLVMYLCCLGLVIL